MKLIFLIFCFVGHVYNQEEDDCLDPVITLVNEQHTKNSIFLSWQATDSVCSYSYDVYWYSTDNEEKVQHKHLETDDTKLKVTELTANTLYIFNIATENKSFGNTTIPLYTAPAEIQNLTITETNVNSVKLRWEPPLEGSGNSTWSEVCAVLSGAPVQCETIDGNECLLPGLASCANYVFTVTSEGYATYLTEETLLSSSVKISHSTNKSAPGKVTGLTVENLDLANYIVKWSEPMWYDAPNCVIGYNVSIGVSDTELTEYQVTLKNTTSLRIRDLHNCTYYNVSVASIGEDSQSDPAYYRFLTAPSPVPEENIVITGNSTTWVEITWEPAESESDCTTLYELYGIYSDFALPIAYLGNISATEKPLKYNFTDFMPCETRQIYILADGEGGSSDFTGIYMTSESVDPGPITNFKTEVSSSRTINLQWNPPESETMCARAYRVCVYKADGSSDSSCSLTRYNNTIYGFDTCTNYTFDFEIIGPRGVIVNTWSTSEVVTYYSTSILSGYSLQSSGKNTLVKWTYSYGTGADCVEHFNICWSIKTNSSCIQADSKETSVLVPEDMHNIRELVINALFNNGKVSNFLKYEGNGSFGIKVSPIFIICCLIIQKLVGSSK